jgi:hypothetical protein
MKEKDMHNPNHSGHYHRDIIKVIGHAPYYFKLLLSCNHTKWMSSAGYKKYKDDATLCMTCSHLEDFTI